MCFHCENGNPHCHIPTEYRCVDSYGVCCSCFKGLSIQQEKGNSPHWCVNRYIMITRRRPFSCDLGGEIMDKTPCEHTTKDERSAIFIHRFIKGETIIRCLRCLATFEQKRKPQPVDNDLKNKLREVADQLEKWAAESRTGGWSTHQVEPMKKEAARIYEMLGRIK